MSSENHLLPTTERLSLRQFTADDRELLYRLHGDERVMRHAGGVLTREQSAAMLQTRILDYYTQLPGLGVWATIKRSSGECIGCHLLNHIQGEQIIQVGYLLFPEFWGRGFATEMCIAVLRYGYEQMRLPNISAITDIANVDSQRVLLKAGMRRNGERVFSHPAYVEAGPLAWFESESVPWLVARHA